MATHPHHAIPKVNTEKEFRGKYHAQQRITLGDCRAIQAEINELANERNRLWVLQADHWTEGRCDRIKHITAILATLWDSLRRAVSAYSWQDGKRPDNRHIALDRARGQYIL